MTKETECIYCPKEVKYKPANMCSECNDKFIDKAIQKECKKREELKKEYKELMNKYIKLQSKEVKNDKRINI